MSEGDPFDPDEGSKGKRDGMGRAERHADPEWLRVMLISALEVAKRKPYFTTDDLEKWRLAHYPNHTTHEHRALGPVMIEAAKQEICEKTGDWIESNQKVCHRRPMRIWWSKVYRGPGRFRKPRRKPINPNQFDLFAGAP
jgi:hypothetical protein